MTNDVLGPWDHPSKYLYSLGKTYVEMLKWVVIWIIYFWEWVNSLALGRRKSGKEIRVIISSRRPSLVLFPQGCVKSVILRHLRILMLSANSFQGKSIYEIFHCVACVSKRDYREGAREGFGHWPKWCVWSRSDQHAILTYLALQWFSSYSPLNAVSYVMSRLDWSAADLFCLLFSEKWARGISPQVLIV